VIVVMVNHWTGMATTTTTTAAAAAAAATTTTNNCSNTTITTTNSPPSLPSPSVPSYPHRRRRNNQWRHHLIKAIDYTETVFKLSNLVNFLLFLRYGRYPTVIERMMRMRMEYQNRLVSDKEEEGKGGGGGAIVVVVIVIHRRIGGGVTTGMSSECHFPNPSANPSPWVPPPYPPSSLPLYIGGSIKNHKLLLHE